MLTDKEREFLLYWERNREKESSFASKLLGGLPMAILFSLPIILSVVAVYLFIPDWYMKISKTSPGTFITIIFAMLLISLFFSFFRMQFKWEMNEQLHKELKSKENRAASNADPDNKK